MNLHEYQAKALLANYGVAVPAGHVARSVEDSVQIATDLETATCVVKAQVHAGGRGKAGGIKITHDENELKQFVKDILGSRLKTVQSDQKGQLVQAVLIESTVDIKQELYLAITVDRSQSKIALITSRQGGMDIEALSNTKPELIKTTLIDPLLGLDKQQIQEIAEDFDFDKQLTESLSIALNSLLQLFTEKDLGLLEINPLVLSQQDELIAVDAKINIDDNALFRQVNLTEWHDASQEDEREQIAKEHGFSYVALDGDIACMVNGAGLAMATMDIIKLYQGSPANFLDVGGGTTAEKVCAAFKLISVDTEVNAILINIFGGIVRCDLIAKGVINAINETDIKLPIVVRLEGTNSEPAKQLLANSGLAVITADDLTDAAQKVIAAATIS